MRKCVVSCCFSSFKVCSRFLLFFSPNRQFIWCITVVCLRFVGLLYITKFWDYLADYDSMNIVYYTSYIVNRYSSIFEGSICLAF